MPSGRLGIADLSANTDTTVYTVPANTLALVDLNLCNRNATAVTVRVALAAAAAPAAGEYIEYDATIPPNGVLVRDRLLMEAGLRLVVRSNTNAVSAVVTGYEEVP